MPHVEIKCFAGRTEEQKRRCDEKIAQDIAEIMGCTLASVSVASKEVPEEDWKRTVWDVSIAPEMDMLYKEPGYTC